MAVSICGGIHPQHETCHSYSSESNFFHFNSNTLIVKNFCSTQKWHCFINNVINKRWHSLYLIGISDKGEERDENESAPRGYEENELNGRTYSNEEVASEWKRKKNIKKKQ